MRIFENNEGLREKINESLEAVHTHTHTHK